jgi:hypothetical protein
MNKYKRKFLVPGETPKGKNWSERDANCERLCGLAYSFSQSRYSPNGTRKNQLCLHGGFWWQHPDYSRCVHQDEVFNQYLVSETEDGKWQCSCKAWTARMPRTDCKHIIKAKVDPKKYEIDPDWTGKTTDLMRKVLR